MSGRKNPGRTGVDGKKMSGKKMEERGRAERPPEERQKLFWQKDDWQKNERPLEEGNHGSTRMNLARLTPQPLLRPIVCQKNKDLHNCSTNGAAFLTVAAGKTVKRNGTS